MAKIGKCCCGDCCLSAAEFNAAFATIKIDSTAATISNNGCCNYASKIINDAPTQYWCEQYWGYQYTESATIQQRVIKTQKINGGSWVLDGFGICPVGYQPPQTPTSACEDVRDCGKTERTIHEYGQAWGVIKGKLKEIRVAIFQSNLSCNGGAKACKYVVQCSARFSLQIGQGSRYEKVRGTIKTTQSPCCEETPVGGQSIGGDYEQYDYHESCDKPDIYEVDPPFNCETSPSIQYGGSSDYWQSRYKIYDTLDDIPSTINFTDDDVINCIFQPSPCGNGDQELCFNFYGPTKTYRTPLTPKKFFFYRSCVACWNVNFPCNTCGGVRLVPGVSYGANYWRYNGKTASHFALGSDLIYDVIAIFENGGGDFDDTCHRFKPLLFNSPGPSEAQIEADVNNCHWWDCVDCIYTGSDPIVPPYQIKLPNVTQYSLTQSYDEGIDAITKVCIPFPSVNVQILKVGAPPGEG